MMDNAMIQIAGYLWNQSGQIALLVAVVAIFSRVLHHRSAHVRYLLWLLVVAKCLVPPFFGIAVPILPQQEQATATLPPEASAGIGEDMTSVGLSERIFAQTPPQSPQETSATRGFMPALSAREVIVLLWLTGLIIFLAIASIKAGRMM